MISVQRESDHPIVKINMNHICGRSFSPCSHDACMVLSTMHARCHRSWPLPLSCSKLRSATPNAIAQRHSLNQNLLMRRALQLIDGRSSIESFSLRSRWFLFPYRFSTCSHAGLVFFDFLWSWGSLTPVCCFLQRFLDSISEGAKCTLGFHIRVRVLNRASRRRPLLCASAPPSRRRWRIDSAPRHDCVSLWYAHRAKPHPVIFKWFVNPFR